MIFALALFTLVVGLSISATAAYFSIVGLAALFAAAFWPVIIMGTVLEVGKVIAAAWLHRYWSESPRLLKIYLVSAVMVLMLITAMGIFGFLSKAHFDQETPLSGQEIKIQHLETRVNSLKTEISRYDQALQQLDGVVQALIDAKRIRGNDGANAIRQQQEVERQSLKSGIDKAYSEIAILEQEKLELKSSVAQSEIKLGPIKNVMAALGLADSDAAIRVVIFMIMFVFDPVAITLVIASQWSFMKWSEQRGNKKEPQVVEIEKIVEKIVEIEKPIEIEKIIEVEKVVEVEKPIEVEKIVFKTDTEALDVMEAKLHQSQVYTEDLQIEIESHKKSIEDLQVKLAEALENQKKPRKPRDPNKPKVSRKNKVFQELVSAYTETNSSQVNIEEAKIQESVPQETKFDTNPRTWINTRIKS